MDLQNKVVGIGWRLIQTSSKVKYMKICKERHIPKRTKMSQQECIDLRACKKPFCDGGEFGL